jgi:hypothetical protein
MAGRSVRAAVAEDAALLNATLFVAGVLVGFGTGLCFGLRGRPPLAANTPADSGPARAFTFLVRRRCGFVSGHGNPERITPKRRGRVGSEN